MSLYIEEVLNIAMRSGGALDEPDLPEDKEEGGKERPGGDNLNFVAGFNICRES